MSANLITRTVAETIFQAATLLETHAMELRECHTIAPAHTDWTGEENAKRVYDQEMAVARSLCDIAEGALE